jgi:hypothetical protein
LIHADFSCFDDHWLPFTEGKGPPGLFVAGLAEATRSTLKEHLRRAYLANLPDGLRSFVCVAWACRGTVRSLSGSAITDLFASTPCQCSDPDIY